MRKGHGAEYGLEVFDGILLFNTASSLVRLIIAVCLSSLWISLIPIGRRCKRMLR